MFDFNILISQVLLTYLSLFGGSLFLFNTALSKDMSHSQAQAPPQAQGECGTANLKTAGNAATSLAVVPYDEQTLSPFHQKERDFTFGSHQLVIQQRWDELGVAAVVWEAAISLCQFLVLHADLVADKRIVELGAGTGIAGILAAKLGAKHVAITDRKAALDLLQENVNLNLDPTISSTVTVEELDWGNNLADFRRDYDVILGADIIYIEETFDLLLQTLLYFSDCKTTIVLSCRIRYDRDERFLNLMKDYFQLEKAHYNSKYDVQIYFARRKC